MLLAQRLLEVTFSSLYISTSMILLRISEYRSSVRGDEEVTMNRLSYVTCDLTHTNQLLSRSLALTTASVAHEGVSSIIEDFQHCLQAGVGAKGGRIEQVVDSLEQV